jgi:hypothetical protein
VEEDRIQEVRGDQAFTMKGAVDGPTWRKISHSNEGRGRGRVEEEKVTSPIKIAGTA